MSRIGFAAFFTMNVMAFTMVLWSSDVYSAADSPATAFSSTLNDLFRYTVMLFAAPVLLLLGWPLLENALANARRGVFSTDLLLSAGVVGSFVYSAISVFRGHGQVYFEVGCVVLLFVTLGRWFEASGKVKANESLERLASLIPDRACKLRDGQEEQVPLSELRPGDFVRVFAGERLPSDGIVRAGEAYLDEQILTGESEPVHKRAGDRALAGTLSVDGAIDIQITATPTHGTLARLINLVRDSRRSKGHYERLADRASTFFVPLVTVLALTVLVIKGGGGNWYAGLMQSLAVILISCPCALGLATPLAVWNALGAAAEERVLFRGGEAIERLALVKAIRFDKTGTLTCGDPAVQSLWISSETSRSEFVQRVVELAQASPHTLCRAIVAAFGTDAHPSGAALGCVRVLPGRGVVATVEGRIDTAIGSRWLMTECGIAFDEEAFHRSETAEASEYSAVWVAWDGRVRAIVTFRERLRPSASQALLECETLKLDTRILTGDHQARGEAVAQTLGVRVESGLLPDEKVSSIRNARANFGMVAMVGDGLNDAPSLAIADVGIALGCGAELSRESATVCLLGDNLTAVPWSIRLARRTVGVIRGNLAWAFGYNSVGLALAALGWLNPAFASILMVGSSALVIMNSSRLRRALPSGDNQCPQENLAAVRNAHLTTGAAS